MILFLVVMAIVHMGVLLIVSVDTGYIRTRNEIAISRGLGLYACVVLIWIARLMWDAQAPN